MTTLLTLDTDCRRYADARSALSAEVTALNDAIEKLKREHLPDIKRLVARAAEHHSTLKSHIEDAPDLFRKPRTIHMHGIKIGYQKGKGGIEFDDADKTVERIEARFGDEATEYLHITKKPDKDALAKLPASELKKLGCTVIATGDEVVIKPTDSTVDKIVNALLKDATDETRTLGDAEPIWP